MIVETAYETGSDPATGLTRYMGRDGHDLRDHSGQELDDDEIEQFNRKAGENEFSRQLILAPERSDLSEKELDRAARKTLNEWTEDHTTTEYVYAVHEDTDHPHVHVAATATQDSNDLWMETDDIQHLQDDIAADRFRDHTTERQRQQMIEQGREEELRQEDRERQLAEQRQQDQQIQEQEQEQLHEQDQQPDVGHEAAELGAGELAAAGAVAGDLGAAGAEMSPASWLLEAYREEQREKEQRQQREREHRRNRR